ncbi:MAG: methylaspartate mutase [Candidatus Coatesbacteria bacterium]|nr:methylaspartate mutase [Candidatus Coatesbacteria bacterium]
MNTILATDCGSTTTKAILIQKQQDGTYRLMVRGEAPTTVEAPAEDVTRGVINAVSEVEELSNRKLISEDGTILVTEQPDQGCDIYLSTSSAGGGLQMMVAGVVKEMTGESAERAALGAGAIVMDVLATNDRRPNHEKIESIRRLRPDIILLSGGIDGGTIKHVVELSEIIAAADPKPRFGAGYDLPVIYAGNVAARDKVKEDLEEKTALMLVDNIRPVLERENLGPARHAIHNLFMEHVMAQAPGYAKLMTWARDTTGKQVPIMPTPGAVGEIIQTIARRESITVVGVDIGGATTDVFSVFKGEKFEETKETVFNRTVSANLGMSYSISNVMAEAGFDNVMRWVPFHMDERDLRNRIRNKMIRPTTIPQTLEDLIIEQGIAREALRLAFIQHKRLAVGLKGVQRLRTITETFEQKGSESLVDMLDLDILVGSGGVLSHAPRRSQSALMLIDAFLPEGFTSLAVDSIFMMPQLGVLSRSNEKAATDVFVKDCLIHLGTCVAPICKAKPGAKLAELEIELPDGEKINKEMTFGVIDIVPLEFPSKAIVRVLKAERNVDFGEGPGKEAVAEVSGGLSGIILDGRGRRPFELPEDDSERINKLKEWHAALDCYPNYEHE